VNDYFKTNVELKSGITGDHLEFLKAKYLETKKAVKPLTLYLNLKRMIDDANAFT